MHCEQANTLLVEFAEGSLAANSATEIEQHLEQCTTCQADYAAIADWRTMANNWHDEVPPAWSVPALDRPGFFDQLTDHFRLWFPTLASATALVLVTVMYMNQPTATGTLPTNQVASNYESLPQLPQATQAAFDNALQNDREQRKKELSSLLEILTAEMNRRSIETEESLRYVVTSQVEGQRELDDLYKQVENLLREAQDSAVTDQTGANSATLMQDIKHDKYFEGVMQ